MLKSLAMALFSVGAAAIAQAQPAPNGPNATNVHVDNASLYIRLFNSGNNTAGYEVDLNGMVYTAYGTGPKLGNHATVRASWKQNGKVLASKNCSLSYDGDDRTQGQFDCKIAEDRSLKAHGPCSLELAYVDDNAEANFVLRTADVNVGRFPDWRGMNGNRPNHQPNFQILGDDLLGSSVMHFNPHTTWSQNFVGVEFQFWVATRGSSTNWPGEAPTFQCSVDGKRIPTDLTGDRYYVSTNSTELVGAYRVYSMAKHDAEANNYNWIRVTAKPNLLMQKGNQKVASPEGQVNIHDYPGAWVCQLRRNGVTLRELRFSVDPNGLFVVHAEQKGPNRIWLFPGSYFVETRFPNPDTFDSSFQPAAIRHGGFYGLPWPDPAALAPMLSALPPAAGSSQPPAVR